MTGYYDGYQAVTYQSRHYESCVNSNCSRSPSPVHRQLWEPKHPPQKLKNNKKLPLKAINTTKHNIDLTKSRDKSPFLPPPRDYNGANTPKRNRDPLFTYSINEGTIDNGNGTNSIDVKLQKQYDSSPSSPEKTILEQYESNPPPKDLVSTGNLKLELELDTSRVPPIITIKNNNTIISQTPQAVQFIVSTPSTTCSQSCPYFSSPNTVQKYDLCCKCCAQLQPCSPRQITQSCEFIRQPCCFPIESSSRSISKKDKATSPTKPCSTPQELEPCNSTSQDCPKWCPFSSSPRNRVDKAISPIYPCSRLPSPSPLSSSPRIRVDKSISNITSPSRSPSPSPLENRSPKPIYASSSHNGDTSSQGTIEINIDEATKVDIDWEGDVGPINVDFPNSRTRNQYCRFEDQVHSHDPQLEAFYTSSNNQSGSPSPPKSRSSSPPSPSLGRQNPRSIGFGPPWNPCHHIDHDCSNKAQSTSISPPRSPCSPLTSYSSRSLSKKQSRKELSQNSNFGSYENCNEDEETRCPCSPSTICSRRSPPKTNSQKELSQNSFGRCEIYSEDGETGIECDYTQCSFSGTRRFDDNIGKQQINSHGQSSSPTLTLTPRSNGKGHMTIEWRNPRSIHEKRCKKIDTVFLHGKSPREEYDDFGPCYQDKVAEDSEINPRAIMQVRRNPTSPNINLEYKTSMQPKNLSCISSCKPTCILTPCTPPYDPCQGSNACCYDCCCCKRDCVASMEGINKCTSLPPHLQSDWSASLRCPEGQVRTKPILYRDSKGHEHIMFADGSIEHLNHHCKPTTTIPSKPPEPSPPPPFGMGTSSSPPLSKCQCQQRTFHEEEGQSKPPEPSPPPPFGMGTSPSPPLSKCQCQQRTFHEEEGQFEQSGAQNFSPQCGDIVIRAHQRLPCLYPGKDNGQVAFFTSDYLDLQEGDSVVRFGKFDHSGRWCSSKRVEMYLLGSHGQWKFLGTTESHPILYPLDADRHQIVRTPNKQLKLKSGDLVISTFPGPNSFYFWNPQTKLDCDHSHLLLRAYIGQPQIVDANHNLACCVMGHLPVGYVELYVKVKRIWLFLGRDEHMFSEHELTYFS